MHDRVKKILKERQKEAEDSLVAHLQVCLPSAVQRIHGLCDFGNLPCRPGRSRYGKHHPFTPDTLPTPQAPHTPGERQERTPNSCHVSKSNKRQFLKTWGSNSGTPRFSPNPTPRTPSRATPRTPWGRLGHPTHPTHPRDADSGCPGSEHSLRLSQNASLDPVDFTLSCQPSHSLPQPLTASHSASQPPTALDATTQPPTAHQSLPQRPEASHGKTVNQNEQIHKLTHVHTAPNATESTHSISQQPEGQHSIMDSPDTLTAPQHTAEDEILSLAFASPVVNSTGGDDSTQWHTAGTQGLVRTEQQATASPDPVDAVREAGRPHTMHKIEKQTKRRTINSKDNFKTRFLTSAATSAATTATTTTATATGGASVSSSDIYQSISRLRRDFTIIQDQILGTGKEKKNIRRARRTRGRRDTDTQTHTHTKRKPLRALDLSCDSGNSDRSVTNPLCDPSSTDSRKQRLERPGMRSGVTGEGNSAGISKREYRHTSSSSSSSSPQFRSPQPCRSQPHPPQATTHPHTAVPGLDTALHSREQSMPNSLVIYIQNFNPPCEDSDYHHHHHHSHSRCRHRRRTRSHELSHTLDLTTQLARTVLRRSESLLTSLSQPSGRNSPRSSPNVACHKR